MPERELELICCMHFVRAQPAWIHSTRSRTHRDHRGAVLCAGTGPRRDGGSILIMFRVLADTAEDEPAAPAVGLQGQLAELEQQYSQLGTARSRSRRREGSATASGGTEDLAEGTGTAPRIAAPLQPRGGEDASDARTSGDSSRDVASALSAAGRSADPEQLLGDASALCTFGHAADSAASGAPPPTLLTSARRSGTGRSGSDLRTHSEAQRSSGRSFTDCAEPAALPAPTPGFPQKAAQAADEDPFAPQWRASVVSAAPAGPPSVLGRMLSRQASTTAAEALEGLVRRHSLLRSSRPRAMHRNPGML